MTTQILLMCASNDTAAKELAVNITLGLHLRAEFQWDNFAYYANLTDAKVTNTVVTSPVVQLDYHNWNDELTAVISDMTDEFDLRFSTEVNIKEKTFWKMVSNFVRATLVSPFVQDEFIFLGFKMILDKAENPEFDQVFLQ